MLESTLVTPRTQIGSTPVDAGVGEDVLRLKDITVAFGSNVANDGINIDLKGGEILALLGENGAGKTTLMNILFGHYVADAGSIEVLGKPLPGGSPRAAIEAGIGMVHQHFALADNLSVLDNIILGTKPLFQPFLNRRNARRKLVDVSEKSGLRVDPDRLVGELTVGEQQRVEILKVLYRGAKILILDEPTAVLTPQEADQLFATIRELVGGGMSVIFISHKLKEVMAISDHVVVLRNGKVVFNGETSRTNLNELAHSMIGRDLPTQERVSLKPGEAVLSLVGVDVTGAAGVRLLDDAHLEVRSHEIIGVAGVSGNGQEALFQVICGLTTPAAGEVTVLGNPLNNATPADLIEMGVARIPEDRYSTGLIADMSVWENLIAERYRSDAMQRYGFFRRNAALAHADAIVTEYDVRCPSPHMTTRLLSGGNMQKLILGRTLSHDPRLIVANQPTRGLDVGAVSFVRERLLEAKKRGAGILLISEDLDELLDLSDRLVVMFEGRTSTPLRHEEGSIRKLGLMMAGHFDEAHHEI
jgi:ABC-type uncharacterized transport system ATPase subunit